ncbi:hypothetical protein ACIHDR_17450 [Nocardia sp. NPDC052278]|uniref:hypothetical protein n=1 Tax=unclassified Nocardia TaxID=2637762 RepID=UPI00368A28F0
MLNPDLPRRTPFVGPPTALTVDVAADVLERYLSALSEWQPEQTHTEQPDKEV